MLSFIFMEDFILKVYFILLYPTWNFLHVRQAIYVYVISPATATTHFWDVKLFKRLFIIEFVHVCVCLSMGVHGIVHLFYVRVPLCRVGVIFPSNGSLDSDHQAGYQEPKHTDPSCQPDFDIWYCFLHEYFEKYYQQSRHGLNFFG